MNVAAPSTLAVLQARINSAQSSARSALATPGNVLIPSQTIATGNETDDKSTCGHRDFSRARPATPDREETGQRVPSPSSGGKAVSAKEPTFPAKLHMILSNPDFCDVIAWLPHGRSWRILQQKAFEERVIPLYFRHGRYSSFARQVNGWGFRRVTHGSDYNSYYHELFLRGTPHLCTKMRRLTTKDTSQRKKTEEEPVPDFYAMSRKNPLPEGNQPPSSPKVGAAVQSTALPLGVRADAGAESALSTSLSTQSTRQGIPLSSNSNRSSSSRSACAASAQALAELELVLLERRRAEILGNLGSFPALNLNRLQVGPQASSISPIQNQLQANSLGNEQELLRLRAMLAMNKAANACPTLMSAGLPDRLAQLPSSFLSNARTLPLQQQQLAPNFLQPVSFNTNQPVQALAMLQMQEQQQQQLLLSARLSNNGDLVGRLANNSQLSSYPTNSSFGPLTAPSENLANGTNLLGM